ncbi:peptidoglycan-binding domain-containing protein [Acidiferrobacter sp.]|uniref:peptidoglycan-binding domain-containing protein n=1 Tax=Acidiferrobacter sp. TaxID=1872107 RepID=UPI00261127EE|nr:peptidoglycan-binding domain-containing protein [Acidiferrobacter sp.]
MSRVRIPLSAKRMLLGLVLAGGASPEAGGAGKLGGHPWVKSLQAALNRREHAHLTVDGIMGPKTRASLKLFQKAHGLKPTGHLDKATEQDLGI